MAQFRLKLKTAVFMPLAALLLLLTFGSLQNAHAQTMPANHEIGSMDESVDSCTGPCVNTSVISKEEQKAPDEDQDEDSGPPEQTPNYARYHQFSEPKKLHSSYSFAAVILRPPDLVKLYASFRF